MDEQERWSDPKQRKLIEDAVMETVATMDRKRIGFLLWCVEGAPWEGWTKNHIASVYRAKTFFDNVPRFV